MWFHYTRLICEIIQYCKKSSCSNHRAVNASNVQRSNLRATGVGATACARHGCFVPHSVVDFQKGERLVLHGAILTLNLRSYQANEHGLLHLSGY